MHRILVVFSLILCVGQQTPAQDKKGTSYATSKIDSLSKRFEAAKDDAAKISVVLNAPRRIDDYYNKPAAIINLYNKALIVAQRIGDKKSIIKLLIEMAYLDMYGLVDEPKASNLYSQALNYAEAEKDYASCAKINYRLAAISEHQNFKAEMYAYLLKAIAYNQKSPVLFISPYRWASAMYVEDNKLDDALKIGKQAVSYVDERSAPAESKALAYGYYYVVLKRMPGRKQEADIYKRKIISVLDKIKTVSSSAIEDGIANVCYEVEQYKLAIFFASQLLEKTDIDSQRDAGKVHIYEMISASYERLGDHQKSLENYKKYSTTYVRFLKNTLSTESGWKVIRAEGERNLLLKQREIEKEQFYRNLSVAISAFILILGGIVFSFYRREQKRKRELTLINATKDKLFAILSHDLRSPVANLENNITLTNWGALSQAEFTESTRQLGSSIGHLRTMLDNLLYWTLSQMEGMKPRPERVALPAVVQQQIDLLQPVANAKQVQIQQQIAADTYLTADRNHLGVIIRNLLQNALKFTPAGGRVWVSYSNANGKVMLKVQDTGIGMDPATVATLFQLNKTVSRPGTAHEPGTGLGLVLVGELVAANGGQISVASNPEQGTTFTLLFD